MMALKQGNTYRHKATNVTYTITSDPVLPIAEVTGNMDFMNVNIFAVRMTTEEFDFKIQNNSAWELVDPAIKREPDDRIT